MPLRKVLVVVVSTTAPLTRTLLTACSGLAATGPGATTTGAERQDDSHAATTGPDGSSIINVAVYGNVRTS